MENIESFLKSCYKYGLDKTDLFQTVDLYEAENLPQVSSIISEWEWLTPTLIL